VDGAVGEFGHRVQPRVEVEQNLDPERVQTQNLLTAVNPAQVLQLQTLRATQMDVQVC